MSDESQHNITKLAALTPSQRVFVMCRARGKPVAESAKEAGVHRATPAATWDMDLINAAILEVQQQMISSPLDAIGHLIPKAIEQLEAALNKGDLAAVREVFDRTWGKAMQPNKTENSGEVLIRVSYANDHA